ncbi:MAG TPA: hypothetical protein VF529_05550 [Solirubrobacteraceae bacterium]|jgi:hypothetical protein
MEATRHLIDLSRLGVGASTGYMEDERGDWPRLLTAARRVSSEVIELSALSADELPGLAAFLGTSPPLDAAYVSVHAPAKGWDGSPTDLAAAIRDALPPYVRGVVVHPETLGRPQAFSILGDRLLLENMDARKCDARTVDELAPYFADLPEAGFCFDVAHAFNNDPSLRLGHELLDAFGDRLREVHVSSILEDGTHVPLRTDDVRRFWPLLHRCVDVPWILEAPLPDG